MKLSEDARKNRRHWDRESDDYQRRHGVQLSTSHPGWGVWQLAERDLGILGDVEGKDVLELGCGAAQWSICLAKAGARPVGMDNSSRQLKHARRLMSAEGVDFRLVHASAEDVPLPDESFDVVLCDHGAMSFADPRRTVPEAARLLRDGGLLAFNLPAPLLYLCWDPVKDETGRLLRRSYFGMRRFVYGDHVEYQLPYGEWIRLFAANGFVVEDLVELRPPQGATTTYDDFVPFEWARRWPAENIWKVRRQPDRAIGGMAKNRRVGRGSSRG